MSIINIVNEYFPVGQGRYGRMMNSTERRFIVYLLNQMVDRLMSMSEAEFQDIYQKNPELFSTTVEFIDHRLSIVYQGVENTCFRIQTYAEGLMENIIYPLLEHRYDIYFICHALANDSQISFYRQLVPEFPYSKTPNIDVSHFIQIIGTHPVDPSFNFGLLEYLTVTPPGIQDGVRNRVFNHFDSDTELTTLYFTELYNFLRTL